MNRNLRWRVVVTLVVMTVALCLVLPSVPGIKNTLLGKVLPDTVINLGLDLKGGILLTLGVDVDKAIENNMSSMGEDIKASAREDELAVLKPTLLPGVRLEAVLVGSTKQEAFEKLLSKQFPNLRIDGKENLPEDRVKYLLSMTTDYKKYLAKLTLDQAVKTIRNRIDQFGVAEPDIRRQEGNRIQVQLPGLNDPERAIAVIGKTAHLEFKIVDETVDPLAAAKGGLIGPGLELTYMMQHGPNNDGKGIPIVLKKEAVLTGENITDARATIEQNNNQFSVSLTFNSRGARIFERVTAENIKKRLAIVLDGKCYSAPVIQDKIAGGKAQITGRFSQEEARDLAIVLRAGALPAPVNVLEQRTIGPTLGQESIDAGIMATGIAAIAIIIFMAIYYSTAGIIADFVLLLNIVLTMAGLAAFGATLTLPGIAGIILTIAMAVDANVLIYERIREELRKGVKPSEAVDKGYGKATLTILDSNTTNVIVAIILYQFGTGPIRGFAVTLVLGIIMSMFTSIFVSRIMFDLYMSKRKADAPVSI
ncbi:MAG: protein translocase subunit SecD [Humidesulfovibrio sp.]|uniref:protein translocase subunit SecD n=1 Tax=Humidesulfovibrio sp. TaxID=2910988 RepID=UPI0027EC080A|nr:protein translocase subunit SecD [Humidesulfovibrio sp.]MDQ7834464.1 protein translocase subunit SecD [Humidesulfovibrio sp.]